MLNLYGHITVNDKGDFTRSIPLGNRNIKEGIYSPITQNRRHMIALKGLFVNRSANIIKRVLVEKTFESYCIPVVVIANPKSILNVRYAKKEVKNEIIKADQLIEFIKMKHSTSKEIARSEKDHMEWAKGWLGLHVEKDNTFLSSYNKRVENNRENQNEIEIPLEETEIYIRLKEYRLNKSRELNIKAYLIFNNYQMEELIKLNPKSLEQLKSLVWINDKKIENFGLDIINIFKETNV